MGYKEFKQRTEEIKLIQRDTSETTQAIICTIRTEKIKVPGGVIIRTITIGYSNYGNPNGGVRTEIVQTFVPINGESSD